jgi:glycosyltransferase involved in cell wall biosynthesis
VAGNRPLLTVAIPTYNRAPLLDKQLTWLSGALSDRGEDCEVLVSDNGSDDATADVIAKWRPRVQARSFQHNRHSSNIGAVRNIAHCLQSAEGRYVWAISDDDPIMPGTITYIVDRLKGKSDVGLLNLNYSTYKAATGELIAERCYSFTRDEDHADGRGVFEQCLDEDVFGVATTTAQVYSSDLVRQAVAAWPAGLDNLAVQIFWSGFCALRGGMGVTADEHLKCSIGAHYFTGDPLLKFRLRFPDMAEVALKLNEVGYSREACERVVLRQVGALPSNARLVAMSARRAPGPTARALGAWFSTLKWAGWGRVASYAVTRIARRVQRRRALPRVL